ncbi:ROK family protein [Vibrio palustris]|uniref:Fructokinase n=1 Tax=Vibrio palustris TaxID=1918946 RepID=A0A1R4B3D4_9VIBR|nr:ROK family protein [Vibrio palustris]SJL83413.1 Fructokinase [Vibrio palustris]
MLIGFDIGGTKIEVCVLDENGASYFKKRAATPDSYSLFLDTISELVIDAETMVNYSFAHVGLGLPGTISPATGLMKNANCTFINGHDLLSDLSAKLNKQVYIANDANCFALSEAIDGAGQKGRLVFGAILGTGCGGGIVFNKTLWEGPNALGGEWGHNPLPNFSPVKDGEARSCYCGKYNCIEQFISGTGLEKTYSAYTQASLSAPDIIEAMRSNDTTALAVYKTLIDQMARSFAAVINMMDPDVIVIGGGLSNVEEICTDLPNQIEQYIFGNELKTNIKIAEYGDSSGIRGAAQLAKSFIQVNI